MLSRAHVKISYAVFFRRIRRIETLRGRGVPDEPPGVPSTPRLGENLQISRALWMTDWRKKKIKNERKTK